MHVFILNIFPQLERVRDNIKLGAVKSFHVVLNANDKSVPGDPVSFYVAAPMCDIKLINYSAKSYFLKCKPRMKEENTDIWQ